MNDIAVSKDGVIKPLKGLNPSKALGPDELHPRVLKELATELGLVFAHFFSAINSHWWNPKGMVSCKYLPLFKEEWQVTCVQLSPCFLDLCTLQVTRTHSMFMGYIMSISICMQNFITIFHSVQEIGPFSLFQNLELDKASTDEKCHFTISWTRSCNINVYAKVYQNIPLSSRERAIFICPLFKKSDRSLACNYRPVSLTCVPCKLLDT